MMQTGDVFVGVDMGKTAHYAQVLNLTAARRSTGQSPTTKPPSDD